MRWIKYQREIPAIPQKGSENDSFLQEEMRSFSDETKESVLSKVLEIAYNGEYTIVDVPMTAEEARARRDKLLADTDWTQVLDAPIDADTREAYRVCRQALRDIPEQEGFPDVIVWPELPAKVKAAPEPVDEAVELLLSGATGEEATT